MERLMKDSGIEWCLEIPSNWQVMPNKRIMHKVKDICEKYDGENILSLTINGVIIRDLEAGGKMPTSFDGYQRVVSGNLLMCLFDIDVTPRCIGLICNNGLTSPAYSQFELKSNAYAPYYYYYYLMLDNTKELLHLAKNLRHSFTEEQLGGIMTPVPPYAEQQKIADFLDRKCREVDELIALEEKMIEELKAYKQSVITETVTKGLDPDVPMKDSGIEWIGQIPEHWEVVRLKNIVKRCSDKASEGLPYIGLENVESVSGRYVETSSEYDVSQAVVCKKGDVIFGKLRPYLAKAMSIDNDSCCSSEFIVLNGFGNQEYVRYLLVSSWFIEIVNSSTYGTKMPRANADFIMNVRIPITHNIGEQAMIVKYLNEICESIDLRLNIKQSKIAELQDYKKSIIYEYATGKKEVPTL